MPKFYFIVGINGFGKDKEEAWNDAVSKFSDDPEAPPEHEIPINKATDPEEGFAIGDDEEE